MILFNCRITIFNVFVIVSKTIISTILILGLDLQRQWRTMKHEFFKEHARRTDPKLKKEHGNKKKKFKYYKNYLFLLSVKSQKKANKAKVINQAYKSSPWLTTDTYESDPNDTNNNRNQSKSP